MHTVHRRTGKYSAYTVSVKVELYMVVHIYSPSTQKTEAERLLWFEGEHRLHGNFRHVWSTVQDAVSGTKKKYEGH